MNHRKELKGMKIAEFMEKFNINNEKAMELIEYKEYLPVAEKYVLATSVADACINVDRNGVYSVDTFQLHLAFTTKMITTYTNLEIEPEETCDAYDALEEAGIMAAIMQEIQPEYMAVKAIMDGYISDKLSYENSTAKILAEGIETLYSAVESTGQGLINLLNDSIGSLDVKQIAEVMNKLK